MVFEGTDAIIKFGEFTLRAYDHISARGQCYSQLRDNYKRASQPTSGVDDKENQF